MTAATPTVTVPPPLPSARLLAMKAGKRAASAARRRSACPYGERQPDLRRAWLAGYDGQWARLEERAARRTLTHAARTHPED